MTTVALQLAAMEPDTAKTARLAIAKRLKEARARVFKTATDAAMALHMKPATVRAHESGQNGVGPFDLEQYAHRYGVSIAWLVTGQGEREGSENVPNTVFVEEMEILTELQDGVWLEEPEDGDDYGLKPPPLRPNGEPETVPYTDSRFPPEIVTAFKVVCDRTEGEYTNGTIVFAVPRWEVGYDVGAHVVVLRSRRGFSEWSLRKVCQEPNGERTFHSLTSDDPPVKWVNDGDELCEIQGVVFAMMKTRHVNPLPIETRAAIEGERVKHYRAIDKAKRNGSLRARLTSA